MSSGPSDRLARYRDGDREAFHELAQDLAPRLIGFFLRQGAQPSTAEDLAQHVFLRVLASADRYQVRGSLEAYFLRIARNLWIDHRRRKRPVTGGVEVFEPPDTGEGPVDQAARTDQAAELRKALAELDEPTRELLELAVLQRLPYAEVSDILQIPVGTVKSRVFYALRRMRDRVSGFDLPAESDSE